MTNLKKRVAGTLIGIVGMAAVGGVGVALAAGPVREPHPEQRQDPSGLERRPTRPRWARRARARRRPWASPRAGRRPWARRPSRRERAGRRPRARRRGPRARRRQPRPRRRRRGRARRQLGTGQRRLIAGTDRPGRDPRSPRGSLLSLRYPVGDARRTLRADARIDRGPDRADAGHPGTFPPDVARRYFHLRLPADDGGCERRASHGQPRRLSGSRVGRGWDVAFASCTSRARRPDLDRARTPGPWAVAFRAPADALTIRRCGTCCSASTPTSTTTCPRRCWR